jgi:hypothetical protein
MLAKTWVFGSLISAIALITTAAPSAAEDHRWGSGRAQWQPPTHAGGWFGGGGDRNREHGGWDRNRDWRGNSSWGHERYAWWRRDHDNRWSHRDWERERRHEGWRRHHDRRWWD